MTSSLHHCCSVHVDASGSPWCVMLQEVFKHTLTAPHVSWHGNISVCLFFTCGVCVHACASICVRVWYVCVCAPASTWPGFRSLSSAGPELPRSSARGPQPSAGGA